MATEAELTWGFNQGHEPQGWRATPILFNQPLTAKVVGIGLFLKAID